MKCNKILGCVKKRQLLEKDPAAWKRLVRCLIDWSVQFVLFLSDSLFLRLFTSSSTCSEYNIRVHLCPIA